MGSAPSVVGLSVSLRGTLRYVDIKGNALYLPKGRNDDTDAGVVVGLLGRLAVRVRQRSPSLRLVGRATSE